MSAHFTHYPQAQAHSFYFYCTITVPSICPGVACVCCTLCQWAAPRCIPHSGSLPAWRPGRPAAPRAAPAPPCSRPEARRRWPSPDCGDFPLPAAQTTPPHNGRRGRAWSNKIPVDVTYYHQYLLSQQGLFWCKTFLEKFVL